MASIILPPGFNERERIAVCRVPVAEGQLCNHVFYAGEERAYRKHVGDCAREHADVIRAESPISKFPMMDPAKWDPEVDAHMGKVGKQMRKEGRMTVNENEKAGF